MSDSFTMRLFLLFTILFSFPVIAQDYSVEQFIRGEGCYSGNCLLNNFGNLLGLTDSTEKILDRLKESDLSSEELKTKSAPFFDYLFQLETFDPSTFDEELQEILRACQMGTTQKTPAVAIDKKHLLVAKALCVKENFRANIYSLQKECDEVLNDTFSLIDLSSSYPGSFSGSYVDRLMKNKDLDDSIIRFEKRIEEILGSDWENEVGQLDRTHPERFPEKIRNLDLGRLAIEVTGSNELAIQLVQVLLSDPGARVIKNAFRERLRREDFERFKKLESSLRDDKVYKLIDLGMYSEKIFGLDFKRNWSNRNYKAIAGMTLGYELGKRGHSKDLSSWASQFIGEAYKIKAHILPAIYQGKSIEGDRPYFVTDSVAHYTGAEFGHNVAEGKGYSSQMMDKSIKESTKRSVGHWKQINRFKFLLE